jgi:hypothetical protein
MVLYIYKLSKPVDEGVLDDQKTLRKWWENRDNDKTRNK